MRVDEDTEFDDDPDAVWLITGASRGFGRELTKSVVRGGRHVVATAARYEELFSLVEEFGNAVIPIELDVNDVVADQEIVEAAIKIFGRVDVVVNFAHYDDPQTDVQGMHVLERMQANLFGALWIFEIAVEYMRKAGRGRIVLVFPRTEPDVDNKERRLLEQSSQVLDQFAEHLGRELMSSQIKVTVCVPDIQYAGWLSTYGRRTYKVRPFTSEGKLGQQDHSGDIVPDRALPAPTPVQRLARTTS